MYMGQDRPNGYSQMGVHIHVHAFFLTFKETVEPGRIFNPSTGAGSRNGRFVGDRSV